MTHIEPRLIFKGEKYILVNGTNDRASGAITTPELFASFEPSYAHLFEDGMIRRFGKVIGSRDDIEWLDALTARQEPRA